MSNKELKLKAKADMKNNYGSAILTMILLSLVATGSATVGMIVGLIAVMGAIKCCYAAFYVDVAKHEIKGVDSTYRGFRQFGRALKVFLIYTGVVLGMLAIMGIILGITAAIVEEEVEFVVIIGVLLAFIFGVALFVLSVKVRFVFFIMNDKIDLPAIDCIKYSFKLTKGRFWKLVGLELSFIGWYILVLLTFGGLNLYVAPYHDTAVANCYLDFANIDDMQTESVVE